MQNPDLAIILDEPIALMARYEALDTKMWQKVLVLRTHIIEDFSHYWAPYSEDPENQSAIHVRRGDLQYFHLDMKKMKCKEASKREQLDKRWNDMDTDAENWIRRELLADRTVHIITDDPLYRDYLMQTFHRKCKEGKVSFGPNASKE